MSTWTQRGRLSSAALTRTTLLLWWWSELGKDRPKPPPGRGWRMMQGSKGLCGCLIVRTGNSWISTHQKVCKETLKRSSSRRKKVVGRLWLCDWRTTQTVCGCETEREIESSIASLSENSPWKEEKTREKQKSSFLKLYLVYSQVQDMLLCSRVCLLLFPTSNTDWLEQLVIVASCNKSVIDLSTI